MIWWPKHSNVVLLSVKGIIRPGLISIMKRAASALIEQDASICIDDGLILISEREERILDEMSKCIASRLSIALIGPRGCGKTTLARVFATRNNRPVRILHVDNLLEGKNLIGEYGIDEKNTLNFSWKAGPVGEAMLSGEILLIEGIEGAGLDVLAQLAPVFENREVFCPFSSFDCDVSRMKTSSQSCIPSSSSESTLDGISHSIGSGGLNVSEFNRKIIKAHPNFAIIVTYQSKLNADFTYQPASPILSHCVPLILGPITDISKIMLHRYKKLPQIYQKALLESIPNDAPIKSILCVAARLEKLIDHTKNDHDGLSLEMRMAILVEISDCLAGNFPRELRTKYLAPITHGLCLTEKDLMNTVINRHPRLSAISKNGWLIGRSFVETSVSNILESSSNLAHNSSSYNLLGSNLAPTMLTAQLLEKVAVSIRMSEPVLLVGETGTGKTTVIQHLAHLAGRSLTVINMSQQTEGSDLLGGLRPVHAPLPLAYESAAARFRLLFMQTFSGTKNASFLDALGNSISSKNYNRTLRLIKQGIALAHNRFSNSSFDRDDPAILLLKNAWASFEEENFRPLARYKSNMRFQIIEGALSKAIKNGGWILLDEINLAAPETLALLVPIMTSFVPSNFLGSSVTVKDTGFRLFACMNPATDAGKRALPSTVKGLFTEIYADETDAYVPDLELVVLHCTREMRSITPVLRRSIIDVYYGWKRAINSYYITDGSRKVPLLNLRTLTRALSFAVKAEPYFGAPRALYEGLAMSFATTLSSESMHVVLKELYSVFKLENLKSSFGKIPPDCTIIEGYVAKKGTLEIQSAEFLSHKFLLTPTVKTTISSISRALMAGNHPILLEGPTGAGKTSAVEYLAMRTGHHVTRINNSEHTDVSQYIGSYQPDGASICFREGLLLQAVRLGHWIILDELNLAPSDVLESLNRLLDDNRQLYVPELDELVNAHPAFRLFATQNPASGSYGGRKALSRAFRSRFLDISVGDLPIDEVEAIIASRGIAPSHAKRLASVYANLQEQRQSDSNLFAGRNALVTLRDMFRWVNRPYTTLEDLALSGFQVLGERLRRPEERSAILAIIMKCLSVKELQVNNFSLKSIEDSIRPPGSSVVSKKIESSANIKSIKLSWTKPMVRLYSLLLSAMNSKEPVLLVGETGTGKTSVCQAAAEALGFDLTIVNCHQGTETFDLLGSLRPLRPHEDDDGLSKKKECGFEWVDGPLVKCMLEGGVILLDEISLADDSVLERLNSVFDHARSLTLTEAVGVNDRDPLIVAHPSFRILATMNPGGDYGKKELSPALRNRFTEIWVPSIGDEHDILLILTDSLKNPVLAQKMVDFIFWWLDTVHQIPCLSKWPFSMRNIVSWVTFIRNLGSSPEAVVHAAFSIFIDPAKSIASGTDISDYSIACGKKLFETFGYSLDTNNFPAPTYSADGGLFGAYPFKIPVNNSRKLLNISYNFEAPSAKQSVMRIIRGMHLGNSVLLEGSPGVGKTSIISALAAATNNHLTRINLSEQTDIVDLFGTDMPATSSYDTEVGIGDKHEAGVSRFEWVDGPFLRALKNGGWILLDELNLASQSVLEGLNACLDHRGTVYIPELGRSFSCKPGTKIFAAQNPQSQGGGRKGLPKSFLNRFVQVWIDPLFNDDIFLILKSQISQLDCDFRISDDILRRTVTFNYRLNDELVVKKSFGVLGSPWECNLRDLQRWVHLVASNSRANPVRILGLIYGVRMRSYQDFQRVLDILGEIFEIDGKKLLNEDHLSVIGSTLYVNSASIDISNAEPINLDLLPSQIIPFEALFACVQMRFPAIMCGGEGKSSLIRLMAAITGNLESLVELSLSSETDTADLLGSFEQRPDKNIFVWSDGPLVRALTLGHWIVLNNANQCSPSVLDRLNSILEPNGSLVLTEAATHDPRVIFAHPNFRIFMVCSKSSGELSRAMRNRGMEICILKDSTTGCNIEDLSLISSKLDCDKSNLNLLETIQILPPNISKKTLNMISMSISCLGPDNNLISILTANPDLKAMRILNDFDLIWCSKSSKSLGVAPFVFLNQIVNMTLSHFAKEDGFVKASNFLAKHWPPFVCFSNYEARVHESGSFSVIAAPLEFVPSVCEDWIKFWRLHFDKPSFSFARNPKIIVDTFPLCSGIVETLNRMLSSLLKISNDSQIHSDIANLSITQSDATDIDFVFSSSDAGKKMVKFFTHLSIIKHAAELESIDHRALCLSLMNGVYYDPVELLPRLRCQVDLMEGEMCVGSIPQSVDFYRVLLSNLVSLVSTWKSCGSAFSNLSRKEEDFSQKLAGLAGFNLDFEASNFSQSLILSGLTIFNSIACLLNTSDPINNHYRPLVDTLKECISVNAALLPIQQMVRTKLFADSSIPSDIVDRMSRYEEECKDACLVLEKYQSFSRDGRLSKSEHANMLSPNGAIAQACFSNFGNIPMIVSNLSGFKDSMVHSLQFSYPETLWLVEHAVNITTMGLLSIHSKFSNIAGPINLLTSKFICSSSDLFGLENLMSVVAGDFVYHSFNVDFDQFLVSGSFFDLVSIVSNIMMDERSREEKRIQSENATYTFQSKSEDEKDEKLVESLFGSVQVRSEITRKCIFLLGKILADSVVPLDKMLGFIVEFKALNCSELRRLILDCHLRSIPNSNLKNDMIAIRNDVNVYKESCPKECFLAISAVKALNSRCIIILNEYPDHDSLNNITNACGRFLELPKSRTIMDLLVQMENILLKAQVWETRSADRLHSISPQLQQIVSIIVRWRRMELQGWRRLLAAVEDEFAMRALEKLPWILKVAFKSYDLDGKDCGVASSMVQLLDQYLTDGPIGEFSNRLSFIQKILNNKLMNGLFTETSKLLLKRTSSFYEMNLLPLVLAAIKTQRHEISQDLKAAIVDTVWREVDDYKSTAAYWSVKETIGKTHRLVAKQVRRYREYLGRDVTALINIPSLSLKDLSVHDASDDNLIETDYEASASGIEVKTSESKHRTKSKELDLKISSSLEWRASYANLTHNNSIRAFNRLGAALKTIDDCLDPHMMNNFCSTLIVRLQELSLSPDVKTKQQAFVSLIRIFRHIGIRVAAAHDITEGESSVSTLIVKTSLFSGVLAKQISGFQYDLESGENYLSQALYRWRIIRDKSPIHEDLGVRQVEAARNSIYHLFNFSIAQRRHLAALEVVISQSAKELNGLMERGDFGGAYVKVEDVGLSLHSLNDLIVQIRLSKELVKPHIDFSRPEEQEFILDLLNRVETLLLSAISIAKNIRHNWILQSELENFNMIIKSLKASVDDFENELFHDFEDVFIEIKLKAVGLSCIEMKRHDSVFENAQAIFSMKLIIQDLENLQPSNIGLDSDEFGLTKNFVNRFEDFLGLTDGKACFVIQRYVSLVRQFVNEVNPSINCTDFKELSKVAHLFISAIFSRLSYLQRSTNKLVFIVSNVFLNLFEHGFCRPSEPASKNEAKSESNEMESGTGMSSGGISGGEKNVSEEIEFEEQINDLMDEDASSEKNEGSEKNKDDSSLEMKDDFINEDVNEKISEEEDELGNDELEDRMGDKNDESKSGEKNDLDDQWDDEDDSKEEDSEEDQKNDEMKSKEEPLDYIPESNSSKNDGKDDSEELNADDDLQKEQSSSLDNQLVGEVDEDSNEEVKSNNGSDTELDEGTNEDETMDISMQPEDPDVSQKNNTESLDNEIDDNLDESVEDLNGEIVDEDLIQDENPNDPHDEQKGIGIDAEESEIDHVNSSDEEEDDDDRKEMTADEKNQIRQGHDASSNSINGGDQSVMENNSSDQNNEVSESQKNALVQDDQAGVGSELCDSLMQNSSERKLNGASNPVIAEKIERLFSALLESSPKLEGDKGDDQGLEEENQRVRECEEGGALAKLTCTDNNLKNQPEFDQNLVDDSPKEDVKNEESGEFVESCETGDDNSVDQGDKVIVSDSVLPKKKDDFMSLSDTEPVSIEKVIVFNYASIESETMALGMDLCEQLRLVLEPTKASKMRGDYRTGKRLNIRKIPAYIASSYRRDKIWLRRTKPAARTYNVIISVDNSRSMRNDSYQKSNILPSPTNDDGTVVQSNAAGMSDLENPETGGMVAIKALAIIAQAMGRLEVGNIGIISFGAKDNTRMIHELGLHWNPETGQSVIDKLTFDEEETDIGALLSLVNHEILKETDTEDPLSLHIILSDGICHDHASIAPLINESISRRIVPVFIILDPSVVDIKHVSYENDGSIQMKRYLDTFPFPYYVLLPHLAMLPSVLSGAIRQWFELAAS